MHPRETHGTAGYCLLLLSFFDCVVACSWQRQAGPRLQGWQQIG